MSSSGPNWAYITLAGSGLCRMLWWDGKAGMQPYGVRTGDFPEYVPAFWGVTMAGSQVVVTDPVNHVLAFYDRGDLVNLVPRRTWWPGFASDEPGEFYSPLDVAADDAGNLYVADYGNDRVQILDKDGKYKALLDPEFRFVGPHALGYAYGKLCVTDKAGTRCRVYDVRTGGEPWFVRELPPLVRADRGLVSASDKVYISGRDEKAGVEGVLVYVPQGTTAVYGHVGTEAPMGRFDRPRGLYLYRGPGDPTVYFANEFPFDVGSYPMP